MSVSSPDIPRALRARWFRWSSANLQLKEALLGKRLVDRFGYLSAHGPTVVFRGRAGTGNIKRES